MEMTASQFFPAFSLTRLNLNCIYTLQHYSTTIFIGRTTRSSARERIAEMTSLPCGDHWESTSERFAANRRPLSLARALRLCPPVPHSIA